MSEITLYLSPSGQTGTRGAGPATRLKVATLQGVVTLARQDKGTSWTNQGSVLTDFHISSLLFEPVSGKLFAGTHEHKGLWVSDDGAGQSWRQVTRGLDRDHIFSIAMRNVGGKVTLFIGTEPAGLYRSDDLGESWTEIASLRAVPETDKWTFPAPPNRPHVKNITFHPTDPRTFYVLVEQGALLKTVDDGASFVELKAYASPQDVAYRDVHRMLIDPAQPNEFFLSTGEGLYRTEDGGESFKHLMKPGDTISYAEDLFFDPADRRTIYMAGTMRSPLDWFRTGAADPAIMKSTDRGDTWAVMHNGLPKPVKVSFEAMCQHVWPNGHMLVLASAEGHIWTSEDGGASWTEIAKISRVSKDIHYVPFLAPEERGKWMARRMERAGLKPPGGAPPRA